MNKPINIRFSSKDLYQAAKDYTENKEIEHLAVLLHWAGDRLKSYEFLLEKLLDSNLQYELEIAEQRRFEIRDEFIRSNFKTFAPPINTNKKVHIGKRKSKRTKLVEEKLQQLVDAIHSKPDDEESYQWQNSMYVPSKTSFKLS